MKKILISIILSFAFSLAAATVAYASSAPYRSAAFDVNGGGTWTPNPYVPWKVIGDLFYITGDDGGQAAVEGLISPSDLNICPEGYIYVTDLGRHLAFKIDGQSNLLATFGGGDDPRARLNFPNGIHAAPDGYIYIADTSNQRIAVFDATGEFAREITKPDDYRLDRVMFQPMKIRQDARGYFYVVLLGGTEGIMILRPDGSFEGYFGSNNVYTSAMDRFKRIIFSDDMIRRDFTRTAASIADIEIDKHGFLYAATPNVEHSVVKYSFNASNLLINTDDESAAIPGNFTSIAVSDKNIITALDEGQGMIFQISAGNKPLYRFSGKNEGLQLQLGNLSSPSAVAVDVNDNIYVADKDFSAIQVFRPTELGKLIQEATYLTDRGLFVEAKPLWEQVLARNPFYYLAHLGITKANLAEGDWDGTMLAARRAYNVKYFSEAYWQVRVYLMRNYFNHAVFGLVLLFAVIIFVKRLRKRRGEAK